MKSNYEERKANRLDAYKNLSAKNEQLSTDSWKRSHDLGSVIPMGQPILVGHHSEKGHRRLLDKIDNTMRRSVEASAKAEYYADKVKAIELNTAISSDDPDAIIKLQEKLRKCEAEQELYKSVNKIARNKKLTDAEKVQAYMNIGCNGATALKLLEPDRYGGFGFPSYRLTNNNGVIASVKKRILFLQRKESIPSSETQYGDIKLVISQEDNRVQIFFPYKPDEAVRKEMKGNGMKWANSIEAWQTYLTPHSIYAAKRFLERLTGVSDRGNTSTTENDKAC